MQIAQRLCFATAALLGSLAVTALAIAAEIAAPYVPTAPSVVDRMLQLANVGPDDFVIDLGSGDGRIVVAAAARYGARGMGVEIDSKLVAQSRANARAAGVGDRVRFDNRDLFATDLSEATVVTLYLLTRSVIKLRPKLYELRPGTRIVSHAGSMGEWKPDRFEMLEVKDKVRADAPRRTYLYLWTVPARVAGTWRWSLSAAGRSYPYEFAVTQHFQQFSGTLRVAAQEIHVSAGKLAGDRILLEFTAELDGRPVQHQLDGRVSGDRVSGVAILSVDPASDPREWNAARASEPGATGK